MPDFWIGDGCPFEIPRPAGTSPPSPEVAGNESQQIQPIEDITYPVRLYGEVIEGLDANGEWTVSLDIKFIVSHQHTAVIRRWQAAPK